jgi:glucosylceramidase
VSKFVAPGAVRIDSPSFVTYRFVPTGTDNVSWGLADAAFRNPDGSEALVAYNTASGPITFAVESRQGRYVSYTLPSGGHRHAHVGRTRMSPLAKR